MNCRACVRPAVMSHRKAMWLALAGTLAGSGAIAETSALAGPPDSAWIEDIHLHPPGPAELAFLYEYQAAPDGVSLGDAHLVTLRTAAGFDRAALDFRPSIGMRQTLGASTLLDHVGLRIRQRIAGTPGQPRLVLAYGYSLVPQGDAEHLFDQGVIARWQCRRLAVSGELGVREQIGGDGGVRLELRAGAALTYGLVLDHIRVGLESFAYVPVKGARVSDYALGLESEEVSLYLGPGVRLDFESLWLSIGLASGMLVDAGSPVTARVIMAAQF